MSPSNYHPELLATSPRDAVRLWVGDTNALGWQFLDAEVDYFLTVNASPIRAAILMLRQLGNRYARIPNVSIEGNSVTGFWLSQQYAKRASELQDMIDTGQVSDGTAPMPYVAGISVTDHDLNVFDTDVVPSAFGVIGSLHSPRGRLYDRFDDEEHR